MIRARRVAEHGTDALLSMLAADPRGGNSDGQVRHRSRISGCTNGSPRRRATSRPKGSTTSSARRCTRPGRASTTLGDKVGAYQTSRRAATCNVSCACHWTVNVAAATGHGKLYADAYSVSPVGRVRAAGIADQDAGGPRGVPISVGYQSGSHYSTIQALEQYMPLDQIKLRFADGMLFSRMEQLIDRKVPAAVGVQRALLLPRAAGLPQDHRHHLHDGDDDHRRSRPGGRAQILPRAAPRAARHRPAPRALHALLQEGIPGALPSR